MMTIEQLTAAFAYEYLTCKNMRKFTRDNAEDDWTEDLEATLESDGRLWVDIERYDDSKHFHTDMEGLLKVINGEGWEMQDLSRDQKDDLEIMALPDMEPIEQTTYTCKSGYVMKVWLVAQPIGRMAYADTLRVKERLAAMKGWYDRKSGGFIVRSRRDAETLWNMLEKAVEDCDKASSYGRR